MRNVRNMGQSTLPPCSYCGAALELETIEVDIGVGVQSHGVGWRCPAGCPFGFACCNGCGVAEVDDKTEHRTWCAEKVR